MERNHLKGCPSVFDDDAIPCICKALRENEQEMMKRISSAAIDGFSRYQEQE